MFFFVALRWAPRPFGGARAKKCFFLLRPRGKAGEGEAPCRHGASPSLAFRRGRSKRNTTGWCSFFLLRPRAGTGLLQGKEKPAFPRGRNKKKNTLGGVFYFAAAPRGRSLTHCGPGWRCLPSPGWCFFFFVRPRPDRGGVFFLLLWPRPDAHSLTVGWGDFGKARVVFFLLLRPRRVFLDNNKKCLGYYIGSKKTRRGHSKKKTPLPACPGLGVGGIQWGVGRPARGRFFFCCGCAARSFFCCGCAASSLTHLLPAASEHPLQKDIQGPGRVFLLRVRSLTHSLAARRPEHPQQKSTHNKNNTGSNPKPYQHNYKT